MAIMAVVAAMAVSAVEPEEAGASSIDVKSCTGGSIDLSSNEKRMLKLFNKARTNRGLRALCVHPALTKAARAHSREIFDKDYFCYASYNGEDGKARLKRFGYTFSGYPYWTYGGNITRSSGPLGAPDYRFESWMESTGHRANILNENFREAGIGATTGTYKAYTDTTMYTADFGNRR